MRHSYPLRNSRIALIMAIVLVLIAGWLSGQGNRPVPAGAMEQNNVGVGYMNQYLFAEAAAAFQKAVVADPGFNNAQINLGIALFYQQDYDRALAALGKAVAREPKSAHAHFVLGLIHKSRGDQEKAIEQFQKVLEIDPKDGTSYYNLGVLKARLRRSAEAESDLRKCLSLEPENRSAWYNLGGLLVQLGRAQEGNRALDRFRELQKGELGGGMGVGNQYGEMGNYAFAIDYRPAPPITSAPPRPFDAQAPLIDESVHAGLKALDFPESETRPFPIPFARYEWSDEFLRSALLPPLGGGVALADIDNDGDIDAVVTHYDPRVPGWRTYILLNDGKAHFAEITDSGIRNNGFQVSAAIGDFDNDGLPDVYLTGFHGNSLFRNLGGNRFEDVTAQAGVAEQGLCISATFVDYDHDGDLDLYVSHYADISSLPEGEWFKFPTSFPGAENRMFRNNDDGTFTEVTQKLGVGGEKRHHLGMIASDIDNDRDVDLVVYEEGGPPRLFSNERNDHFSEVSAIAKIPGGLESSAIAVADWNGDGAMDLLAPSLTAVDHALLMNRGGGAMTPDARSPAFLQFLGASLRRGVGVLDFDLDGTRDLFSFGQNRADGAGALWRNDSSGRFFFAGRLPAHGCRGSAAADLDGDGRPDLLYLDAHGVARYLHNTTRNANHWIGVRLEGLRSNKMGFGAKIEVRAGASSQKVEVSGHGGNLSQDSAVVWFGLGAAKKADTISVRWPSGILQSEINVPSDQVFRVRELDRKGTSCPLLYTWNGKSFEFVTDFLGGCAIGYLEAPMRYSIPDTDEYVRIEGRQLAVRDGKYLLNLNNQLEEVILFDQAQLLVVDHPAGTDVYPNERLMPEPPFPDFKIHTIRDPRVPVSSVDEHGHNVLPRIAKLDRVYPDDFRPLRFKGYAETHSITLDLGDVPGDGKILLLMDAWIDYADSSANLAASHAGISQIPPYLEVRDRQGQWKTAIPSMGFPAGLPKTMVVDLSGKFLSSDHHVRIVTNMKIYWDRIRFDFSNPAEIRQTRLDPIGADLHFRGYPKYYSPDGAQPWIYDYGRIQPTELWGTHAGAYTRFGDVLALLVRRDDQFVITRHGDEISLIFDATQAPKLPDGWSRDFFLYADGYGKDMDLNSLYPEVVGPLPFHAMSRFPYPANEHYPNDEEHQNYQRKFNTRVFPLRAPRELTTKAQRLEN